MAVVKFELKGDAKGLTRATQTGGRALKRLDKVAKSTGGKLRKMNDATKRLSGGFTSLSGSMGGLTKGLAAMGAVAVTAAAAGLAMVGKKAIEMGMDAVESENLFTVSMKDMATAAREWSVTTSKALGLNQFELRKNVGVIFQMTKSMGIAKKDAYGMATGITQLANDMASFFNLAPADAFMKLQAGITGEAEPLKRLGILVDETTSKQTAMRHGIIKQGEAMSQTQKVQARWLAILDQTKDAQGDLARTMDSPANKMRILQTRVEELVTELGMHLLPIWEFLLSIGAELVDGLSEMARGFHDVGDSTGEVKTGFQKIAELAALPIKAFFLIGSVLESMILDFLKAVDTILRTARSAIETINKIPGANIAMFGTLRDAFKNVNEEVVKNQQRISDSTAALAVADSKLKAITVAVAGIAKKVDPKTALKDLPAAGVETGEELGTVMGDAAAKAFKKKLNTAIKEIHDENRLLSFMDTEKQSLPAGQHLAPMDKLTDADLIAAKPTLATSPAEVEAQMLAGLKEVEDKNISGIIVRKKPELDAEGNISSSLSGLEENFKNLGVAMEPAASVFDHMGLKVNDFSSMIGNDVIPQFLKLGVTTGKFGKVLGGVMASLSGGGGGGLLGGIMSKFLPSLLSFIPGVGPMLGAVSGAAGGAAVKAASGGIVNFPSFAVSSSGQEFTLAEMGPEAIVPLKDMSSFGGGGAGLEAVTAALSRLSAVPRGVVVTGGLEENGGVFGSADARDRREFQKHSFGDNVI